MVHASTARRQTLAVGQRVLEVQNTQAQPLSAYPEEKASERMAMSSDGSMVPLVGGVWAEVKVVAIGSGSVESSHKLVVQARLKGPAMHRRPEHINPVLALRLALLNERWAESWQEQHRLSQQQRHLTRQARQQQRVREQQANARRRFRLPCPLHRH